MTFQDKFCGSFDSDEVATVAVICNSLEGLDYIRSVDFEINHFSDLENCDVILSKKDFGRLSVMIETIDSKESPAVANIMSTPSPWDE